MRIDVHTLGAFHGLAQQGAMAASGAFRTLTGESTTIEVRGVNVTPAEVVRTQIDDHQAAVVMDLSGGVDGRAFLTFGSADAARLQDALPAAEPDSTNAVLEVGNILVGRLLDDLANALRTGIDVTPPVGVSADEAITDDVKFLFECRLIAARLGIAFDLYLGLENGAFDRLLEARADPRGKEASPVPSAGFEELSLFSELVDEGVTQAANHAAMLTGLELDAEPNGLRFITLKELTQYVKDSERVGAAFSLSEPPGGFVLFTFDRTSAYQLAGAMVPGESAGAVEGMIQDAVQELGNVMTSGLIDGWASLFGASIDHSPPEIIGDPPDGAKDILHPFIDWLDEERRFGFLVDATIRTPNDNIECDIYAMPDDLELLQALDRRATGS